MGKNAVTALDNAHSAWSLKLEKARDLELEKSILLEQLENEIDSFNGFQVITKNGTNIGCVYKAKERGFIKFVAVVINPDFEDFAADFSTKEDFERADGQCLAKIDAITYALHVKENNTDKGFEFRSATANH